MVDVKGDRSIIRAHCSHSLDLWFSIALVLSDKNLSMLSVVLVEPSIVSL